MGGNEDVSTSAHASARSQSVAAKIRAQIEAGGERFWTYADFRRLPLDAAAKSLSRLTEEGALVRSSRGIYYRPRPTVFGPSQPSETQFAEASAKHKLHPAGISASNLLGFTTQNVGRPQYVTTGPSVPTKLLASKVFTRRPAARENLTAEEGAFLEFLRTRGAASDYSPEETGRMAVAHLQNKLSFGRLAQAATFEPPRVRAILGAIAEEAGQPEAKLEPFRKGLNRLSRFDFGPLRVLKHARSWQAK